MTPSAEQIRRRAIFRWGIRWALAAWLVGSFLILPGTALLAGRVLPQPGRAGCRSRSACRGRASTTRR